MATEASDLAKDSVMSNANAVAATPRDSPPSFDLGINLSPEHSNPQVELPSSEMGEKCLNTNSLVVPETPENVLKMLPGTPASGINHKPVVYSTPGHRFHRSSSSPGTLAKILAEGALVDRMVVLEDKIDINSAPWDHDFSDSPITRRHVVTSSMASPPWSQKLSHRVVPQDIVNQLFEDVKKCDSTMLDSPWILHKEPRVVNLDGRWIHSILVADKPLSYDVCDLLMGRFVQLDQAMYQEDQNPHWRLFLKSEFTMLALAGEPALNRKSIRHQFLGEHITFNIEQCRMVTNQFPPTFIGPASYFDFDSCTSPNPPELVLLLFYFKDRAIHVIDPLFNTDQSLLFHELHSPSVSRIASALSSCIDAYFEGWDHRINEWETGYVLPPILDAATDETGMLSVMYAREFDGLKFHSTSRHLLSSSGRCCMRLCQSTTTKLNRQSASPYQLKTKALMAQS